MSMQSLFDEWPEKYDQWFETSVGRLIKEYENNLILELLEPDPHDWILDAGCGTGVFTLDILTHGAGVVGLDISAPMLKRAGQKAQGYPFHMVLGGMQTLPFSENTFDKVVSITALEFITDAKSAVEELFRVTKHGGRIVVATLNNLSPWASRRKDRAKKGQSPIFEKAIFRSPDDLRDLSPVQGVIKTAIHFQKNDDPNEARKIELEAQLKGLDTGAFVAARWDKR